MRIKSVRAMILRICVVLIVLVLGLTATYIYADWKISYMGRLSSRCESIRLANETVVQMKNHPFDELENFLSLKSASRNVDVNPPVVRTLKISAASRDPSLKRVDLKFDEKKDRGEESEVFAMYIAKE